MDQKGNKPERAHSKNRIMDLFGRLRRRYRFARDTRLYREWVRKYDTLTAGERAAVRSRIDKLEAPVLISVIMPTFNPPEQWLRKAIESVRDQIYENWELCIADDGSTHPHVRTVLEEYAAADERIRVVFRRENGNISAASNSALEMARGEFVALMDHDDELSPRALALVAEEIERRPELNLIYTDEDQIDRRGRRYMPKFKPDWSPELFYSFNLVTHLCVYRTSVVRDASGFRIGFEGSQDYDLALRVTENIPAETIAHIPRIGYHWRASAGSAAASLAAKPYAYERARKALNEHFQRTGVNAHSVGGPRETNRTVYRLPEAVPAVSIILFGGSAGLQEVIGATAYGNLEIVVVGAISETADNLLSGVHSVEDRGGLYESLNRAAAASNGSFLCFLNGTTRVMNHDWLSETIGIAQQTGIGAVGGKILYPNGRVKHAGYILGINGGVGRAHHNFPSGDHGNNMRLSVMQNFSAVSVDCLTIRRDAFDAAGGFAADDFPTAYADVDLCLRLINDQHLRNVWTPWATVIQDGASFLPMNDELQRLRKRWPDVFENDPYYNPNLTGSREDFSPACPPRSMPNTAVTDDTV